MNHTENYQLSQWERSDRVLMEDFNVDNAKIDAVLGEHTAQIANLGNCRIEMFTYTGTGTYGKDHPVSITFSTRPKAFIAVGADGVIFCRGGDTYGTGLIHASPWSGTGAGLSATLQWSGNTVRYYGSYVETQLNREGTTTWIIAFYAQDET